jgi:alpha-N-arabinofuranosidase
MKRIYILIVLALVSTPRILCAQSINATIDTTQTRPPITKYMYGQFLEHLGNIINTGIWAEMLDDRKFYYAVTSHLPMQAATAPRGRGFLRRWTPIGPDEFVTMDTTNPYIGQHSPLVKLDVTTARGIQQSGVALRSGKSYIGRIILAGDASANVQATLIWGDRAEDRQTINIEKLTAEYTTIPLKFTSAADTDNGRIEITGIGTGAFHIGAISLMPSDNIQGFRAEVIDALKQLHSGVYRFPGGNYISNYDWRDAVGERDLRAPRWDYAWNAVQPNDVGLDEFMVLFNLLDVEPYMTINAGFGDADSAAALVEYANGAPTTPMGQLRAANGHPQPYGIKLWGIGNEMYGDWQLGVMPPDQYQIKHNIFAAAMHKVDPTIKLIGSGAMPDEMTVTLQGKRLDGKILTAFGSKADWTGGMIAHCLDNMDMISEHCYCTAGQGFDMTAGAYVNVDEPLVDWARRPANRVRAKYEAYQQYLQRIPAFKARPIPISLDEYSYRRSPATQYKTALAYAWQFDETFRHTDVFQMTAFTFATSCLSANRTAAVLNPVGLVFKMYRDHFGTLPVEVTGNSPQPKPRYPIGGDQPQINAGSDTYPLDVCAALSEDRKTLTVAVINPTETQQQLNLSIIGVDLSGSGKLWRMAPSDVNASIVIGQPAQVRIEDQALTAVPAAAQIAPISVNIYELAVK